MRHSLLLVLLLAAPGAAQSQTTTGHPDSARIVTSDIPRFWAAWDRLQAAPSRADSLRALFEDYYLGASPGLEDFIASRIGSVHSLLSTLTRARLYYASMRESTLRAAEFEPEIRRVFRGLESLYPTPCSRRPTW